MKLFIKNMVCQRCQMVVKSELEKLGIYCSSVEVGTVETIGTLSSNQLYEIKTALFRAGLELMDDKRSILVERIKVVILKMINHTDEPLKTNFSNYLNTKLNLDYTYLANVFSEVEGTTIEHFIIINRVRKVKELICNQELNLTEISWKLNYSSVAHLSTQFKKVTGITPSSFKHMECNNLQPSKMCEL
jgi:YesN/AraC family two-component response regulator